ncbi:uncharacterized protein LOC141638374 isoform X1 [Silene latifolia]|uniref:uncharacterized protein LOC141638374 isoform X1 n=1 Tax=Silene latifolia TaxID=37657 RepID=UPI003D7866DB
MGADTTDLSYWLNWRFLVSALYVFGTLISAFYLIWKYEGKGKLGDERRDGRQIPDGVVYKDELWKTCLEGIHPFWLLLFRILAFGVLLAFIIGNTIVDGPGIFYYYTQLTFVLTTIYFGLASAFSLYGFCHDYDGDSRSKTTSLNIDAEQGPDVVPKMGGGQDTPLLKNWSNRGEVHVRQIAGFMGYLFQTLYQVAGGAVLLTDVVYWLLLYPVKSAGQSKVAFFDICAHSVNILILGDALLNGMRFPIFRIAYFVVWTGAFVIYQWIFHVFISLPWPYPFMDLSPPYSPLWYLAVGVMHVPCYGCFALIVKLKHLWLSRSFSDSYQDLR